MRTKKSLDEVSLFFKKNFRAGADISPTNPRWVGLENEYILVNQDGTMMRAEVLPLLWQGLTRRGWEPVKDEAQHTTIAVKRRCPQLIGTKAHAYTLVTTDLSHGTLEICLAPARSLHEAAHQLLAVLAEIVPILRAHNVTILGYGLQPVTPSDPCHISTQDRYALMLDICHDEQALHSMAFHTIDAACQTQVEVSLEEAIPVVNALNASAGLRIALLANSSIWQQRVSEYKGTRHFLIDTCWEKRKQQLGIPARFQNIEHYIDYIFDFRSLLIRREQAIFRLDNRVAFRDFFLSERGQLGTAINGDTTRLFGKNEDVLYQCGQAWFCARLQPAYGTVEDRAGCQQPPHEHLCSSALTLGLVENARTLGRLTDRLSLDQWREIRVLAYHHGMGIVDQENYLEEYLQRLLAIATEGLQKRALGEEVFLEPLFARMAKRCGPADEACAHFLTGGIPALVAAHNMEWLLQ